MARWYRRRRFRRYRKYRRFYRRYRRTKAPINNSQRSRCRVRITATTTTAFLIGAADDHSYTMGIVPFCGSNDWNANPGTWQGKIAGICSLVSQPLYQRFASLYDEVKIDSMVVSVTLLSPLTNANPNAITFHTCWDRKNSYHENRQYAANVTQGEGSWPGWPELQTLSSHMSAIATTNSIPKIVRSCAASDLLERIVFIDTDYNANVTGNFDHKIANEDHPLCVNLPWYHADADCPCFHPAFFMAISLGAPVLANTTFPVSVQVSYTCTFRNPKYGGSSGARSAGDMPVPAERGLPPAPGDPGFEGMGDEDAAEGMDEHLSGIDVAAAAAAEAGVPDGELDDATMGQLQPNQVEEWMLAAELARQGAEAGQADAQRAADAHERAVVNPDAIRAALRAPDGPPGVMRDMRAMRRAIARNHRVMDYVRHLRNRPENRFLRTEIENPSILH